jgi:hypothetical protein
MAIRPHPAVPSGVVTAVIDPLLARYRGDWCVIQRKSASLDPAGAPISGGFTTIANVDCQVVASGRVAVERVFGGQFGPEAELVIKVDRAVDVHSDDQIIKDGKTMQVVSSDEDKSYGFELLIGVKAT